MDKKFSRRDFAKASLAAGAAAVALPTSLLGKGVTAVTAPAGITGLTPAAAAGAAAASSAIITPRGRVTMPIEVEYGGRMSWGRDLTLQDTLTPAGVAAPNYPNGWKEGTTIPAEYYLDEKQYRNDEHYLKENFWFMVDHQSRIPKPGDYFVFEFGEGSSVIVLRDTAGQVQAYHNVCRHRGSRLVQHGFDGVRPTEALPDGKPADKILSMVQLGPSGNTPVIRCVYHAWTYDLSGKLVAFPSGMPDGFDPSTHGLHPCHVQTVSGFIWLSLASGEAPEFEPWIKNWKAVADKVRDRRPEDCDPSCCPDQGQLEAGARELPRVLSLLPGTHEVLFGRAPELRRPERLDPRTAGADRCRAGEVGRQATAAADQKH